MKKTSFLRILPFFILAILVHGLYNFLVSFEMIGLTTGLIVALVFVIMTIYFIRIKIRTLDRQIS